MPPHEAPRVLLAVGGAVLDFVPRFVRLLSVEPFGSDPRAVLLVGLAPVLAAHGVILHSAVLAPGAEGVYLSSPRASFVLAPGVEVGTGYTFAAPQLAQASPPAPLSPDPSTLDDLDPGASAPRTAGPRRKG